jgi:hypothetical protein
MMAVGARNPRRRIKKRMPSSPVWWRLVPRGLALPVREGIWGRRAELPSSVEHGIEVKVTSRKHTIFNCV